MEDLIPLAAIVTIFLGLPWLILSHITKWKQAKTLTGDDEQLLDQMYDTARRLENRLDVVERILRADNPDFRPNMNHKDGLAYSDQTQEAPTSRAKNRRK